MSNKPDEEEKSPTNLSKAYSVSVKYNKSKFQSSPLDIEDTNSSKRSILRNAGKELMESQKYLTTGEISQDLPFSQSILCLKHKGIKKRGHPLYDPYLIRVCKKAIISEKKELPNYKEIIQKVNTEFGIEDQKNKDKNYYLYKYYKNNSISNNNSSKLLLKSNSDNNSNNRFDKSDISDKSLSRSKSRGKKHFNNSSDDIKEKESGVPHNKNDIRKNIDDLAEKNATMKRIRDKIIDDAIKKKRKDTLINGIKYLSFNNISVEDYLTKKIFPSKPFELRGSEEFMDAVKFNKIELVKQGLKRDEDYLIQYDYFLQTPFHWAAKLGYYDLLRIFIDHSKMINIYDRELRTPLFLAALNNHKKCVEILLDHGAYAFFRDRTGKMAEDVTTEDSIRFMLQNSPEKQFSELNEINKKKEKEPEST